MPKRPQAACPIVWLILQSGGLSSDLISFKALPRGLASAAVGHCGATCTTLLSHPWQPVVVSQCALQSRLGHTTSSLHGSAIPVPLPPWRKTCYAVPSTPVGCTVLNMHAPGVPECDMCPPCHSMGVLDDWLCTHPWAEIACVPSML